MFFVSHTCDAPLRSACRSRVDDATTSKSKTGCAGRHRPGVGGRDHPLPQDLRQPPRGDRVHRPVLEDEQRNVALESVLRVHHPFFGLLCVVRGVHLPRQGLPSPPRRRGLPRRPLAYGVRAPYLDLPQLDVRCVLHRG